MLAELHGQPWGLRLGIRVLGALGELPWSRHMIERALLGRGTCTGFVADFLTVASPYQNPMFTNQTEAESPYLLAALARGGAASFEQSPIIKALWSLNSVAALDADVELPSAIARHCPGLGVEEQLLLLAQASHNHAFELVLQQLALETQATPAAASAKAMAYAAAVNHLYGLLALHQAARRARFVAPEGSAERRLLLAERPYHYYAGALVACALVRRGYPGWLARHASAFAGVVYERQTAGEAPINTSDTQLHADGARAGVVWCANETKQPWVGD
jgi:hypothetical protein